MSKSVFGLNERIVAAVSNATLGFFGVIAYLFEKENKFVKFHALQSFITFFGLAVLSWGIGILITIVKVVPVIGGIFAMIFGLVNSLLGLVTLVAWAYLTYTSYKGQTFKVPIIGDIIWSKVNKGE